MQIQYCAFINLPIFIFKHMDSTSENMLGISDLPVLSFDNAKRKRYFTND